MKKLLILLFLVRSTQLFSQDADLIRLAFRDRSTFDITTSFDNDRPKTYYVWHQTMAWNPLRFQIREDLSNDSVRKAVLRDEHSAYYHSYIFKVPKLDTLFNARAKQSLYENALQIQTKEINATKEFQLVSSFKAAPKGYFFTLTSPLYSGDKKTAFLDIYVYYKTKETKSMDEALFGSTLLVFQLQPDGSWKRIHKLDYVIL